MISESRYPVRYIIKVDNQYYQSSSGWTRDITIATYFLDISDARYIQEKFPGSIVEVTFLTEGGIRFSQEDSASKYGAICIGVFITFMIFAKLGLIPSQFLEQISLAQTGSVQEVSP